MMTKNRQWPPHILEAAERMVVAARASNPKQALALAKQILQEAPDFPVAIAHHAIALSRLGRNAEGVKFCRQAIKRFPKMEILSINYFSMLRELGHEDKALREMRRFMNLKHSQFYEDTILPGCREKFLRSVPLVDDELDCR